MAVSPPKPDCHTNKRQMYGGQSTQTLLSYICLLLIFQMYATPPVFALLLSNLAVLIILT